MKIRVGSYSKDCDMHLCPGQNLFTGARNFEGEFSSITSLEEDLLNLAAGVYGADLSVIRNEREHFIRTINIKIEVVNFHAFDRIRGSLVHALHTVSRDNWNIEFIPKSGQAETKFDVMTTEGSVLLFSGGIDSMCAAADFLNQKKNIVLVSHNTPGNHAVDKCQRDVHTVLEEEFKTKIKHIHLRVFGRNHDEYTFPKDDERENTQRTRSFLFLSLAALVSRRFGFFKVMFMAENGQFAIHLPLNSARVGPFSTHTADPEFVSQVEEIFKTLFNNSEFKIENPYLYKTKGEVFSLLSTTLRSKANQSGSCWMISRKNGVHCGYCIPCISRRIAIEYNNTKFAEYEVDIFDANLEEYDDTKDQRRNITDYLEFISRFKNVSTSNKMSLLNDYPELYNPAFDMDKAIELYRRVSSQSFQVFANYPKVLKIIG